MSLGVLLSLQRQRRVFQPLALVLFYCFREARAHLQLLEGVKSGRAWSDVVFLGATLPL